MAALLFDDVTDGLRLVGCPFQPPDLAALKGMLGGKTCSKTYTKIVVWVCEQMGGVESIAVPECPDEEPMFRVELSSVLTDLGCPVPGIGGAESLSDPNNRTAVLHYLLHELMSVRLAAVESSNENKVNTESGCFSGHPALRDLALIYSILELPSPGPEDETLDIFETVIHKLQENLKKKQANKDVLLSGPMLKYSLTPDQWERFEEVCHILNEEYTTRFKTLVKRCDLTLTSFKWGKNKDKAETIDKVYGMQRRCMKDVSCLGIADVLAARLDLACLPKTSSGAVRDNTKSKLNKMVIVGKVPDRGGRPLEQRPEPEIPSWLKNKSGYSKQSRGGQNQASKGNRYQQAPRQDKRDRSQQVFQPHQQQQGQQQQGYQQQQQGYQAPEHYQHDQRDNGRGGGGHYAGNRGNQGGQGSSWGGYNRGRNNRGGIY